MKRFAGAALAIVLLVPVVGALELPAVTVQEAERLVVGFHEYSAELDSSAEYQGARVVDSSPELRFIVVETESAASFRVRASLDENVRYVESDVSDHVLYLTPNDYFYGHAAHWGTKKIGAETAWDRTTGATSVKVAMVDSGLNFGHEEYSGQSRVLAGKNFHNTRKAANDESGCGYHGTHTTGTAGATINNAKGVAGLSQHTILPVKIFGSGGCTAASTSNIAKALKYAADEGSHFSSNSWGGGGFSTAINDAITYAHDRGVVHVAAAGNSGPCSNCVGNPWKSATSPVIVVSASDQNDGFAGFSSQGPQVDIIAPGVYIASSTSGTNTYHAMDGTSMAAPHVTGTLALVKTLHPTWGFAELENAIKSTAVNLGLSSDRQGAGRLNADGAVQ